jgi:hypothetical protein
MDHASPIPHALPGLHGMHETRPLPVPCPYSFREKGEASSLHPAGAAWGGVIVPPLFRGSIQPPAIKNHPSQYSFFENEPPLFYPHMPLISQPGPHTSRIWGQIIRFHSFFFE